MFDDLDPKKQAMKEAEEMLRGIIGLIKQDKFRGTIAIITRNPSNPTDITFHFSEISSIEGDLYALKWLLDKRIDKKMIEGFRSSGVDKNS